MSLLTQERTQSKVDTQLRVSTETMLLIGIMLVAVVLRFYKLGAWSLWIDEAYSLPRAQAAATAPVSWLPLSNLLMGISMQLFGVSEWSARLTPALTGILSLPLFYYPVRRLWGNTVGLLFIAMLAVSPWHLFWSQNARFYVLLLLFYTLSLLLIAVALEERGKWRYLLLGIAALLLVLAVRERLISFFLVVTLAAYVPLLLLIERRVGITKRMVAGLALLLLVPIGYLVIRDVVAILNGQTPSIQDFFFRFVGSSNKSTFRFIASYVFRVGIPPLLVAALGSIVALREQRRLGLLLVVSAAVPPVALTVVTSFVRTVDRYALVALPSTLILAAIFVKEGLSHKQEYSRLAAIGLLAIILASGLAEDMLYFSFQNGQRPNWKDAFALVEAQKDAEDVVYTTREELGDFYMDSEVRSTQRLEVQAIEGSDTVSWFVISTAMTGIDPSLHGWIKQNASLVESLDVWIPGKVLDMRVYRYAPTTTQ